jgi:hypothetical protein
MDKIYFITQLCNISNDVNVNKNNFDLAVGYDKYINVVYGILHTIAAAYKLEDAMRVKPINFSAITGNTLCVEWRIASRKKINVTHEETDAGNGFTASIANNSVSPGYILTVTYKGE